MHFGFDSTPPSTYMNSGFGYTTINLKSRFICEKQKHRIMLTGKIPFMRLGLPLG